MESSRIDYGKSSSNAMKEELCTKTISTFECSSVCPRLSSYDLSHSLSALSDNETREKHMEKPIYLESSPCSKVDKTKAIATKNLQSESTEGANMAEKGQNRKSSKRKETSDSTNNMIPNHRTEREGKSTSKEEEKKMGSKTKSKGTSSKSESTTRSKEKDRRSNGGRDSAKNGTGAGSDGKAEGGTSRKEKIEDKTEVQRKSTSRKGRESLRDSKSTKTATIALSEAESKGEQFNSTKYEKNKEKRKSSSRKLRESSRGSQSTKEATTTLKGMKTKEEQSNLTMEDAQMFSESEFGESSINWDSLRAEKIALPDVGTEEERVVHTGTALRGSLKNRQDQSSPSNKNSFSKAQDSLSIFFINNDVDNNRSEAEGETASTEEDSQSDDDSSLRKRTQLHPAGSEGHMADRLLIDSLNLDPEDDARQCFQEPSNGPASSMADFCLSNELMGNDPPNGYLTRTESIDLNAIVAEHDLENSGQEQSNGGMMSLGDFCDCSNEPIGNSLPKDSPDDLGSISEFNHDNQECSQNPRNELTGNNLMGESWKNGSIRSESDADPSSVEEDHDDQESCQETSDHTFSAVGDASGSGDEVVGNYTERDPTNGVAIYFNRSACKGVLQKSSMPKTIEKSVSFDSITVHYHSVVLGDCQTRSGPPIALGWDRIGESEVYRDIEKYEAVFRSWGAVRVLSAQERFWALQGAGYTAREILEYIAKNRIASIEKNRDMDDEWSPVSTKKSPMSNTLSPISKRKPPVSTSRRSPMSTKTHSPMLGKRSPAPSKSFPGLTDLDEKKALHQRMFGSLRKALGKTAN